MVALPSASNRNSGFQDDEVDDQQLHQGGRAADNGDVEPTDGVSQLQQEVARRTEPLRAGLVVGTAHHGDEDPQDQANDQRQQGDDDSDLQAVSDVSPTVFFDKVRNKFLLHFCKPSTQMLIPSC